MTGDRHIGIIMNGVTGRMGTNQHLIRSIAAIRDQGGIRGRDGSIITVDPILVGRDEKKLAALAQSHGVQRWTTDLAAALANADADDTVYFDAQRTELREPSVKQAIAAGKHVYCEKPISTSLASALELAALAEEAGI
jgi:predicted dehydrogenase